MLVMVIGLLPLLAGWATFELIQLRREAARLRQVAMLHQEEARRWMDLALSRRPRRTACLQGHGKVVPFQRQA